MARTNASRSADKDDPIYKGGFVISSHPVRPKETVVTDAEPKLGEDLDTEKSEDQD